MQARGFATIHRRVQRRLARCGLAVEDAAELDPLAEESPALAGISSASVQGRGADLMGHVLQPLHRKVYPLALRAAIHIDDGTACGPQARRRRLLGC